MSRMTKAQVAEQEEARASLREMLPPGSTVYTTIQHVSRSGMRRAVKTLIRTDDGIWDASYMVARAIGWRVDDVHGGIKVDGCGMDMAFHTVYVLSSSLYPAGFDCIGDSESYGKRCPSNDHTNDRGARNYAPTRHHTSGGYAIRHSSL
jgi:hypothetical protein